MKLLFFPKYTKKGASSRYRIYQYLPFFINYDIKIYPFFDAQYSPVQSFKNLKGILYASKCYLRRLINMCRIKTNDLVFVQYEFTQFLPFNLFIFKLLSIKYIVDYDDAAFHDYDQNSNIIIRKILKTKIATVIKNAQIVITGSPYLTEYALKYNSNVVEIPTSIDFSKYNFNRDNKLKQNKLIIGWIGSKTTSVNLLSLIPVFENLVNKNLNFEIRCIGFDSALKENFSHLPFTILEWDAATEIIEINKFSVGIMPLNDTPFNNGKCAFKLIQYMACGIVTISSPLAANLKVNRGNKNYFATNTEEWTKAFIEINDNLDNLRNIGDVNREIVEEYYSIKSNVDTYLKLFNSITNPF